jgi:toxin CcdB
VGRLRMPMLSLRSMVFGAKEGVFSDAVRCISKRGGRVRPDAFLLDVQADLLSEPHTRVAVPLVRSEAFGRKATRMHPQIAVVGQDVVMATHPIAAVRRQILSDPVSSLRDQRDVVISAIDVLWSGV